MAPRTKSLPHKSDGKTSCIVALLRGINVGGCNRLPMADLVAIFREVGCDNVRTYIQSGNVVFWVSPELAATLPASVSDLIAARFNIHSPVIMRSASELDLIVARNPFVHAGLDAKTLHVAFLANAPAATGRVAAIDPNRSPGDSFHICRDIYLHLPNGAARTKLTNRYLDTTLATTSTLRNWRTALKLRDMACGKE